MPSQNVHDLGLTLHIGAASMVRAQVPWVTDGKTGGLPMAQFAWLMFVWPSVRDVLGPLMN